jgi:hypothetical protein
MDREELKRFWEATEEVLAHMPSLTKEKPMTEKQRALPQVFKSEDFDGVSSEAYPQSRYYAPANYRQAFADTANRILLERSVRVYSHGGQANWERAVGQYAGSFEVQGLLVAIEPIAKPDTAESLLAEIVQRHVLDDRGGLRGMSDLIIRASRLLDRGPQSGK